MMSGMTIAVRKTAVAAAGGPQLSAMPNIGRVGNEHGPPGEGLRIIGIQCPIATWIRIGIGMVGAKTIGMNRMSDPRSDGIGNSSANDAVDGVPMSVCPFHASDV